MDARKRPDSPFGIAEIVDGIYSDRASSGELNKANKEIINSPDFASNMLGVHKYNNSNSLQSSQLHIYGAN